MWDGLEDDYYEIGRDERIEAVETTRKPDLYEYAIGENWKKLAQDRLGLLTAAQRRLLISAVVNIALVVALAVVAVVA